MNLAEIKYKNNKIATLTDTVPEIVLDTSGTYLDGYIETGIVVPEYDGSYTPPGQGE